mmetsp:Transcript_63176/g.173432  ORF Transcript_63176/g.173432 Transcript_63176/m.173432 type:complete len:210 (-) Transcript_63176:312-941(-)
MVRNVPNLVRDDGVELVRRQRVHEALSHGDHAMSWPAPRGERVRLVGRDEPCGGHLLQTGLDRRARDQVSHLRWRYRPAHALDGPLAAIEKTGEAECPGCAAGGGSEVHLRCLDANGGASEPSCAAEVHGAGASGTDAPERGPLRHHRRPLSVRRHDLIIQAVDLALRDEDPVLSRGGHDMVIVLLCAAMAILLPRGLVLFRLRAAKFD